MAFSRFLRVAGLASAVTVLAIAQAHAEFPERKVQVVYPWAPGTPTYGVSQLIAEGMAAKLGQPVPVVATPGSGGVKAFKTFLDAPADGYTVVDGYVAPLVLAPMFGDAEWGCDDFVPLYSATSNSFAIASRPDETRWSDFPSFVKYVQEHPGETKYNGNKLTLPHMVAAKVLQQLNLVSRPVPYEDLALGMKDLRNGILDWLIINPGVYRGNTEYPEGSRDFEQPEGSPGRLRRRSATRGAGDRPGDQRPDGQRLGLVAGQEGNAGGHARKAPRCHAVRPAKCRCPQRDREGRIRADRL